MTVYAVLINGFTHKVFSSLNKAKEYFNNYVKQYHANIIINDSNNMEAQFDDSRIVRVVNYNVE